MSNEVTSEGKRLIERWLSAQNELEHCKSRVNSAECDLSKSQRDLAKWLLPDDAKPGEKIAVWFGDSLIQVEAPGSDITSGGARVSVRKRGKSLRLAA